MARQDASALERALARATDLHSSPHVAQRVLEAVADDDYDVQAVVELLQCDPGLSTAVLRLVNSSHSGLRHKVESLRQAVALLGRRSLRLTVLSFGLVDSLTRGSRSAAFLGFWRRAFSTAALASRLAARDRDLADRAYTAGLLTDIGELLLMQQEADRYLPLIAAFPHGRQLMQAELSQFGFHHAQLGAALLEKWGFPEQLVEAIRDHHELGCDPGTLTRLIQDAHVVNDFVWNPAGDKVAGCRDLLQCQYGIDMDGFIVLVTQIKDLVNQSEEIFGIRVMGEVNADGIRQLAQALYFDCCQPAASA